MLDHWVPPRFWKSGYGHGDSEDGELPCMIEGVKETVHLARLMKGVHIDSFLDTGNFQKGQSWWTSKSDLR